LQANHLLLKKVDFWHILEVEDISKQIKIDLIFVSNTSGIIIVSVEKILTTFNIQKGHFEIESETLRWICSKNK
jgi:hypothetical protein